MKFRFGINSHTYQFNPFLRFQRLPIGNPLFKSRNLTLRTLLAVNSFVCSVLCLIAQRNRLYLFRTLADLKSRIFVFFCSRNCGRIYCACHLLLEIAAQKIANSAKIFNCAIICSAGISLISSLKLYRSKLYT